MANTFTNFDEFWAHYVRAHSKKGTRDLHFVGTSAAMALAAAGLLTRRRYLLLLAPVVGYGFAWASHFLVEGNTPATFGNPLWSLQADFLMWRKILDGTMDGEVDRVVRQEAAPAEPEGPRAPDPTVN